MLGRGGLHVGQVTLLPDVDVLADERINLTALWRIDENSVAVAREGVGRGEAELLVVGGERLSALAAERPFLVDKPRHKGLFAFEESKPCRSRLFQPVEFRKAASRRPPFHVNDIAFGIVAE